MIGRNYELQEIEALYNANKFEFLVLYGRRRIGKATLLIDFANKRNCFYFLAQEKNTILSIKEFTSLIKDYFNMDYMSSSSANDLAEVIAFLTERIEMKLKETNNEKVCIIIDESPTYRQRISNHKKYFTAYNRS